MLLHYYSPDRPAIGPTTPHARAVPAQTRRHNDSQTPRRTPLLQVGQPRTSACGRLERPCTRAPVPLARGGLHTGQPTNDDARRQKDDDEKMPSAHTATKPETPIDGVRQHWRPPRQREDRLVPPMRAWLTQPHGRHHMAPPQPCALTTTSGMMSRRAIRGPEARQRPCANSAHEGHRSGEFGIPSGARRSIGRTQLWGAGTHPPRLSARRHTTTAASPNARASLYSKKAPTPSSMEFGTRARVANTAAELRG